MLNKNLGNILLATLLAMQFSFSDRVRSELLALRCSLNTTKARISETVCHKSEAFEAKKLVTDKLFIAEEQITASKLALVERRLEILDKN